MSNEQLISIIVPVFNTEHYLAECIDSVLEQTYSNFELILIDDGSTDGSGAICDFYKDKDDRIRVIHKKNGGVSSARNVGLDCARGEWIYFLDSDDVLIHNGLQSLWEMALHYNADIVSGVVINENYQGECISLDNIYWEGNEGLKNALIEHRFTCGTCAKLLKRESIGETRFDEKLKINEDGLFMFMLFAKGLTFVGDRFPVFMYRIHSDSASRGSFSEKYFDILRVSEIKYNWVKSNLPQYLNLAESMKIKAQINLLSILLCRTNREYRRTEKELIRNVCKNKKYFVPARKLDFFWYRLITMRLYFVFKALRKVKRKLMNRGIH